MPLCEHIREFITAYSRGPVTLVALETALYIPGNGAMSCEDCDVDATHEQWDEFVNSERHAATEKATAITEPARPESVPSTGSGDVPSNGSSYLLDSSPPAADGEAAANDGVTANSTSGCGCTDTECYHAMGGFRCQGHPSAALWREGKWVPICSDCEPEAIASGLYVDAPYADTPSAAEVPR